MNVYIYVAMRVCTCVCTNFKDFWTKRGGAALRWVEFAGGRKKENVSNGRKNKRGEASQRDPF